MTMNMNDPPAETWDVKRELTDEASVATDANSNADSKKKRSWKKPKDKPMRPLSAYNMFFQNQRERIVAGKTGDPTPEEIQQSVIKMLTSKTRGPKRRQDRVSHGQISFGDLARTIAAKWKSIDPKLKAIYNHYAAQEKVRYKKEVVIWKEKKEREHDAALAAKRSSLLTSSSTFNDSMASYDSSMTSMTSMNSYNMSESINSLQNGVSIQMSDDVVQRQQDILRQQMGFIDSKPQARMGGNDTVSRELPKSELGGSGDDVVPQGFQFPRPIGGNGRASSMNIIGTDNSNTTSNEDLSRPSALLDSNLQLHNQRQQKEQLLLRLQQQQLQQLKQLQQARNETSRLSNMKTTDTFMRMQPSKISVNGQHQPGLLNSQGTSNSANAKQILQLQDQFKELEGITLELDRLKEQERQMQQKIKEHQNMSNNGSWTDEMGFSHSGNASGPHVPTSGDFKYTEFSTGLNDTGTSSLRSTFDQNMDDRQRSVRRSRSGDTNVYRGSSSGSNPLNGSSRRGGFREQSRRHSMFGSGDGTAGNAGFSSVPNSFNFGTNSGMGDQNSNSVFVGREQQDQNRRDSLAALLQLDDSNNMNGIGGHRRQQIREELQQQQSQSNQNALAAMMQQMQETQGSEPVQDIGATFNMDMGC